jgi:CubicO group peptidase (beta-lactamase class C family)
MKIITAFLFLLTFVPGFIFCQSLYYPDTAWQTKNPSDVNMSASKLDSAVKFALINDSKTDYNLRIANMKAYANEPGYRMMGPMKDRGKPAGVIVRKGYIVAQWGDCKRVDMTFSVAKSYLSTVAGLAVDAGLIRSVDDKLVDYVTDGNFETPHNAKITWRHLLTQSSDWSGCLFDVCDWADRPPKQGSIDEWSNRKLLEPGTNYEYNDVRVNLLAYSLLQTWRKPLPVVFKEKIMDRIGASTTWRWYGYENSFVNIDGIMIQSVSGGGHFGGGLFINTFDQARFGLLFLRKGKWKNEQLVSQKWISEARQPSLANPEYGFLWWLNEKAAIKGQSKNIYYANGFGGNFIVVDEEHDLLIVTRWLEPSKISDFVNLVIASMENK